MLFQIAGFGSWLRLRFDAQPVSDSLQPLLGAAVQRQRRFTNAFFQPRQKIFDVLRLGLIEQVFIECNEPGQLKKYC